MARAAVILDWSIGSIMLDGARTDGALILAGASGMLGTVLAPRVRDYALTGVLHIVGCLTALNLDVRTRTAAFVCAMVFTVAYA